MNTMKTRSMKKKIMDISRCKRRLEYDFSAEYNTIDDERHYADMYLMKDGSIYRSQNGLRRSKRMIHRWTNPRYFSDFQTQLLPFKKRNALKFEDLEESIMYKNEIMCETEAANIILSLKIPRNIKK